MLKFTLYFFAIILLICSCRSDQHDKTTINAKIYGLSDSWVKLRLLEFDAPETIIDSVYAQNEAFSFQIPNVQGGICVDFYFHDYLKGSRNVFIREGEEVNIMGNMSNHLMPPQDHQIDLVVSNAISHEELLRKEKEIDSIGFSYELFEEIIKKESESFLTPVFILLTPNSEKYYELLSREVQESYYGGKVKEKIARINRVSQGRKAPNLRCKDHVGKNFSLYSTKGEYIILDFWASWCKPCRKSHPLLIDLYQKYHDQGLEIISISIDEASDRGAWLQAINDDGIGMWTHLIHSDCSEAEIADLYNVDLIPTKYVLDTEKRFLDKIVGGDSLKIDEYIDQLYNELSQ